MALQVFVGTGSCKTSTGTQAYTGIGFQPKAVIFFGTRRTADGVNSVSYDSHCFHMGFSTGSSKNYSWAIAHEARTGDTENRNSCGNYNNKCLTIGIDLQSSPWYGFTVLSQASMSSLDSDGFTLNFSTAATAHDFHFICIGGDGVSVFADEASEPPDLGNEAYTGVGFQPDFGMFLWGMSTAFGTQSFTRAGVSFATATEQAMMFECASITGYSLGSSRMRLRTTKLLEYTASNSDTVLSDSVFISFDSDGFTLDRDTDDASDRKFAYLVVKGVQADITQYTQPTSAGTDANTGVGFQPSLLMLMSHSSTAASYASTVKMQFGAGISSTARGSAGIGLDNTTYDCFNHQTFETDEIIQTMTNAASPAVTAEADLTSLDSDGHTLEWSTADATARIFIAISLKDNTAAAETITVDKWYQETQRPKVNEPEMVAY